ncbi:M56 family metallopeptidase [Hyalangium gracile]|uniref:M56 family metallopeptidase n=1 Tax=Hyalangium gracile TaxID=394092 RepID=UPI001CC9FA89|nr:M56 family metallopeptidase [Hyalangium gracile]
MGTHGLMDLGWGLSLMEGLWRASWQGALCAALVWALTRAVPRMPPSLRAGLWWLVSLKFVLSLGVLSPVALPLLPAPAPAPLEVGAAPLPEGEPVSWVSLGGASASAPRERPVPWRQVGMAALLAVWGMGIAWQLRGHVRAWASVRRLRLRALPLRDEELEDVVRELSLEAGLRRVPRLLVSSEVASPLATGLLSPVVVLPARAVQRLDADALRMALAHELAHFQRRDLWLGWVPAVAETLLFFHPLVRKAAREYALAREEACDAEALRLTGAEPGDYGQLLLAFGVTRSHGTAAALGASAHLHALHRRLTMLEHVDVSTPRGRAPLRAALLVLGAAVLVPFQVVAREPPASPPAPTVPAVPAVPKVAATPKVAAVPATPPAPASVGAKVSPPPPVAPRVAAPPAPPAPVVAPLAPVAPVPPATPMLAMSDDDDDDHDDDVDGYVLVSGDHVMMSGSTSDLRRARSMRTGGKDVLFIRRGDKAYLIRDPKMLEQVRATFEPQTKLGQQQAELGKKQAELGAKQAEFGQKQAALGVKHAQLGLRNAELSLQLSQAAMRGDDAERDRKEKELEKVQAALEKEQDALNDEQEALGKEQEKLGEQQEKLGEQQEKLGEQQEKLAHESQKKVKALIDDAITKGLAEPVGS